VESGTGEIIIDGTRQALEPGTCAVVGCDEVHELRNTGNTDLVITYFGVKV
jgi:mannose-6-phosphate isomerase-like protein (cupin superfamily)